MEKAKTTVMEQLYIEVTEMMFPHVHLYETTGKELVYQDIKQMMIPVVSCFQSTSDYGNLAAESENVGQDENLISDTQGGSDKAESAGLTGDTQKGEPGNTETIAKAENGSTTEHTADANEGENSDREGTEEDSTEAGSFIATEKQVEINRNKLNDFDYLRQNFYQIDNTTTIGSELLNAAAFLEKDMALAEGAEGPQILIYHTHSHEAYADSAEGDSSASVVAVGEYLTTLLTENYGVEVIHHTGVYDEPRDSAYSNALPNIRQILEDNPTIEVVIDLHRDAVPETMHLVTEVNGKPTAKIMFFNGLSRTTSQGELEYLANPNLEDNLAFSFQMQLTAAEYYPDLTRKIYLKGYRYNMHLCPKSLLVEVGAQNNSFQEALNSMEPLADVLAKVLKMDKVP